MRSEFRRPTRETKLADRVPFYWKHAIGIQTLYLYRVEIANFLSALSLLAMVGGIALGIAVHMYFFVMILPFLLVGLPYWGMAGILLLYRDLTQYEYDEMRVNEYVHLDRKSKRKLKPVAKLARATMNHPMQEKLGIMVHARQPEAVKNKQETITPPKIQKLVDAELKAIEERREEAAKSKAEKLIANAMMNGNPLPEFDDNWKQIIPKG